jgi:hypothetical protein
MPVPSDMKNTVRCDMVFEGWVVLGHCAPGKLHLAEPQPTMTKFNPILPCAALTD